FGDILMNQIRIEKSLFEMNSLVLQDGWHPLRRYHGECMDDPKIGHRLDAVRQLCLKPDVPIGLVPPKQRYPPLGIAVAEEIQHAHEGRNADAAGEED